MSDNVSVEVQLAQMAGNIALLSQAVEFTNKQLSTLVEENRQQAAVIAQLGGLNIQDRLVSLDKRVDAVELHQATTAGERSGVSNTVKVMWTVAGAAATGVAALVARGLGV